MADSSKQKLDRLAMKCWIDSRKTGISYTTFIKAAAVESFGFIQRVWARDELLLRVVMLEYYGVQGA